jgi:thiamine-phosphate pyrophosphorylase
MVALQSRVYPIADTEILARRGFEPAGFVEALLDGGARLVQFRHKSVYTRKSYEDLEAIAALCRGAGAQLIVNDRADFAAIFDAGLHVGQDDLPPALARRVMGGGRMLGLSTHTEAQLRAAAGESVDYVALGPIFRTDSKRNADPEVGVQSLKAWRPLVAKPLVAIGGITLKNVHEVLAAGADCVALIGALLPESNDLGQVKARMETWIRQVQ